MNKAAGIAVALVAVAGCSHAHPVTTVAFRAEVAAMYAGLRGDVGHADLSAARLDGFAVAVGRLRAPAVDVAAQATVVSAARAEATAYRQYQGVSGFSGSAQTPDVAGIVSTSVALREAVQAL